MASRKVGGLPVDLVVDSDDRQRPVGVAVARRTGIVRDGRRSRPRSARWSPTASTSRFGSILVPHQGQRCSCSTVRPKARWLSSARHCLHLRFGLLEALGADADPDPQPDAERLLTPGGRVLLADQLGRADQRGCALELLRGEQAQRVAHQHGDPVAAIEHAVVGVDLALQPADREGVRREAEVGLGLAATGREEQQLDVGRVAAAERMRRVGEGRQLQQDEGELERAPRGRLVAFGLDRGSVRVIDRQSIVGGAPGRRPGCGCAGRAWPGS